MKRRVQLTRRTGRIIRTTAPKRFRSRKVSGTQAWYEEGLRAPCWTCENCGCFISHTDQWQQYAAQAHILPKEIFESVKNHALNRLWLCLSCHADWDSSWQKARSMKVFPVAKYRFDQFSSDIRETEQIPLALTCAPSSPPW